MTLTPEVVSALIGGGCAIVAAVVTLAPFILTALRRTRRTVTVDGSATRDALTVLTTKVTEFKDESRTADAHIREGLARVREWQAAHDAEHLLIGRQPRRGGDNA